MEKELELNAFQTDLLKGAENERRVADVQFNSIVATILAQNSRQPNELLRVEGGKVFVREPDNDPAQPQADADGNMP